MGFLKWLMRPTRESQHVVLGKVVFRQDTDLALFPVPEELEVRAGDELHVKFLFEIHDEHCDDHWQVALESRVDGGPPERIERTVMDRPFLDDTQIGFIGTAHRFPAPGKATLEAVLLADHTEREWAKARTDHQHVAKRVRIPIRVLGS